MTEPLTIAQAIEAFGVVAARYVTDRCDKQALVQAEDVLLSAIAADRAALADALAGLIQSLDGEPEHLGDRCHVCAARRTARAALAALPQPVGDPT